MKKIKILFVLVMSGLFPSCEFLDVVPDNVATLDHAFVDYTSVRKYLATCYSYIPNHGSVYGNPAHMGGDELWMHFPVTYFGSTNCWNIARNEQNVNSPLVNTWDGGNSGTSLFQGIRDCNIFLSRVDEVKDMEDFEKERMKGEVLFLKGYFHFLLMKHYGPIPLMKENLPVSATPEEVKVFRASIDEVGEYVLELFDQAIVQLNGYDEVTTLELGRISRTTVLAMKAKVLVTLASPMFNGNTEFSLTDKNGKQLFPQEFDPEKWVKAKDACKAAIDSIEMFTPIELYYFADARAMSDSTRVKMNIRNSVSEQWNGELIWGNSGGSASEIQRMAQARIDPNNVINEAVRSNIAPPLRIAEMFYTEHGVPISEDKEWDYENRFKLRQAEHDDRYYIETGYKTVGLHFDREPRFYASLGFDGGVWYGQGRMDDDETWVLKGKKGQPASRQGSGLYSATGYWPKKLVFFENEIRDGQGYNLRQYPFPVIRLADLYLLYAEALNESKAAPDGEVYDWIDRVRARAGLKGVVESWTQYAKNPNKVTEKAGMREIIQQERLIELAFEGQRFWDLRRWKRAGEFMNKPIKGWHIDERDAEAYYVPRVLFAPTFNRRDYLWPIKQSAIVQNTNLVQNPGW
ncbi:starch-binding protein [Fulvitalea axinellae]|uniref:Starch-binding protein n=1 Tax=Fulvitalea axinellae TaxID=1182444 RepID=A0AAU9CN56_9BACT|nr:starch-binding protein [Fulvitalea axinellae]